MYNRNNEEFNFDDGIEEAIALKRLEPDAHPSIPDELPEVELEREQVTDALDTIDPDTDPMITARAMENAEFDIREVTSQDSHEYQTSKSYESQDQDIDYEIIIESNEPLMESDETHQDENNSFEALDDMDDEIEDDDFVPEQGRTGTRSCRMPQLYQPDFGSTRYDDTSKQIHIQADDVMKAKLPKIRKCDKFDNVVHSVMIQLSLEKGLNWARRQPSNKCNNTMT